jgi:hypothetical protein
MAEQDSQINKSRYIPAEIRNNPTPWLVGTAVTGILAAALGIAIYTNRDTPTAQITSQPNAQINTAPISSRYEDINIKPYDIQEVKIGDQWYSAIKLGENETFSFGFNPLNRNTVYPYLLTPQNQSSETVDKNNVTVEGTGNQFGLVNLGYDPASGKGFVNTEAEPIRSTIYYNRSLEEALDVHETGITRTRSVKAALEKLPVVKINGKEFYTTNELEEFYVEGANPLIDPDFTLDRVFMAKDGSTIPKVNRENGKTFIGINGLLMGAVPVRETEIPNKELEEVAAEVNRAHIGL